MELVVDDFVLEVQCNCNKLKTNADETSPEP